MEDERRMLGDYIMNSIRPIFKYDKIDVELVKCEDIDLGYTGRPSQEIIDDNIRECNIFLFLFKVGAGEATLHEFEVAREVQTKKLQTIPTIRIYFFDLPEEEKSKELLKFQGLLNNNNIGLYWTNCKNREDLRGKIEHDLILYERRLLDLNESDTKENTLEREADARFAQYEDSKRNQLFLKKKLHQDIGNLLKEVDKVMGENGFTTAEKIFKAKKLYMKADLWAEASEYEKKSYARLLFDYAQFLEEYGFYYDSKEIYLRQIHLLEEIYGGEHKEAISSYNNLGEIYRVIGEYHNAREYYHKVLNIFDESQGRYNPNYAIIYNNIGLTYYYQGVFSKALEYYLKAIEVHNKEYGSDHPMYAKFCNNIGSVYWKQRNYTKALEYYFNAKEKQEKDPSKNRLDIATTYNNIATVYSDMGKFEFAMDYYFKALSIREKELGFDHPDTATIYHNIGSIFFNQKSYGKALDYMDKAYVIFLEKLGPQHTNTIIVKEKIDAIQKLIKNGHL
ncbi:MAG: tetratricopeptide repeat protein [Bacteroidales bacterium]|nr:tetratricopeptide repeat protein [Bacteroidales bacterium]